MERHTPPPNNARPPPPPANLDSPTSTPGNPIFDASAKNWDALQPDASDGTARIMAGPFGPLCVFVESGCGEWSADVETVAIADIPGTSVEPGPSAGALRFTAEVTAVEPAMNEAPSDAST